jgi:hypothetical protein
MTTVSVHHQPTDLLRLALYATFRSGTLRWTLLILSVALFVMNLQQQKSHLGPITWIAIVLTTFIFSAGALVVMLALTVLSTLLRNRKGSPAAEVQTYSLTEEGLARRSASSDTLLKWGGARSLRRSKNAIYVGVSASSYFILPRRVFPSEEDYQSFWSAIQKLAPDNP